MTREEAYKAILSIPNVGLTGKGAKFLLNQAERFGNCPALYVEVIYTKQDGFAVIDYSDRGKGGSGIWVTPGTANG
jgi:hypothetical protein